MDTVHAVYTVHMRCSHVGVFFQMLKIYVGRSEESFRWDYFFFFSPLVFFVMFIDSIKLFHIILVSVLSNLKAHRCQRDLYNNVFHLKNPPKVWFAISEDDFSCWSAVISE